MKSVLTNMRLHIPWWLTAIIILETLPMFRAVPYYRRLWKDGLPKDSYNKEFIDYVDSVVENLDKKEGSLNI